MPPYDEYLSHVSFVPDNSQILELGSGSGLLSGPLVSLNSRVTLSDLSPSSLDLLRLKYQDYSNVIFSCCDIQSLPFQDNSFDFIFSAGTLSYGDPSIVFAEIYRVKVMVLLLLLTPQQ